MTEKSPVGSWASVTTHPTCTFISAWSSAGAALSRLPWPRFPGRQIIFWDLRASECERHRIKASTRASFKQKKALPHEVEDTLSLPALHTIYQLFILNQLSLVAALQNDTLPPPGRSRSSPGSISSVWWALGGVLISSKNNDTGYLLVSDRNSSGHLQSPQPSRTQCPLYPVQKMPTANKHKESW